MGTQQRSAEYLLPTWCQKTRGIGNNPDFMRSLGAKKNPRLPHSKRPNPGWGGNRQAQWPERRFEAHRGSVGQTGFWVKSWDFILKCEGFERFNLQPSRKIHPPILPKFAWLSWKKDQTRVRRTLSQTFFLQERSVTVWASRSVLRTKSSTGMEHGTVQWPLCPCSRCSLWWPQEPGSRDHITWCVWKWGISKYDNYKRGNDDTPVFGYDFIQILAFLVGSELKKLLRLWTHAAKDGNKWKRRWIFSEELRCKKPGWLGAEPIFRDPYHASIKVLHCKSCILLLMIDFWLVRKHQEFLHISAVFQWTLAPFCLSDLDLGNPPRPRRVRFAFSEAREVSHWGAPRAMQFQDFTIGIVHFMHFILGTWRFMTTNGQLWSNWEWRNIVKSQKPPVYGLFSMEYHADLGLLAPQFFGRTHIPMIVHCIPILLIASITQFFLAT